MSECVPYTADAALRAGTGAVQGRACRDANGRCRHTSEESCSNRGPSLMPRRAVRSRHNGLANGLAPPVVTVGELRLRVDRASRFSRFPTGRWAR
jgi:hypothetical protein